MSGDHDKHNYNEVEAQMEAGALLASALCWSLKMGAKVAGPCAGSIEPRARELCNSD